MENNKLWAVMTSRKAWAAILTILTAFGVDHFKDLDPAILVIIIGSVGAMYMGSVALEDGLSSLADGLTRLRRWWVEASIEDDDDDDDWPPASPVTTHEQT